jgi:hypothetical protein
MSFTYQGLVKETNLYDAIHVAERKKSRAKPGLCPRVPPRRVDVVKHPIPQLERGTGSGKVIVRIAACGISKSWRQKHPEEIKKYIHLLNMKMTEKPDISAFLSQHPTSDADGSDHDEVKGKFIC